MDRRTRMIHIGCCGYTVGKSKYHENLEVVELPQTFFQPPGPRVLANWRDGAPAGFEFVVRAWQLITHDPMSPTYSRLKEPVPDFRRMNYGHFRQTPEVWRAWEQTEKAARILRARIVVFQSPPNFKPSPENEANMRAFFGRIKTTGLEYVWDARAWKAQEALPLCEELGLTYAIDPLKPSDEPACGTGKGIMYVRLAGKGGFKYCFSGDELCHVLERCTGGRETYVIFDNSYMYDNALALNSMAASPGTGASGG